MATQKYLIEQVRRKISDFDTRDYEDDIYLQELGESLGKLNTDFGEEYVLLTAVPNTQVHLLVKLGAIGMCYIRAADALKNSAEGSDEDESTVQVPDLMVTRRAVSATSKAEKWLELAEALQKAYDSTFDNSGGSSLSSIVQQGTINAVSKRNGGLISRRLDRGLSAVTVIADVPGTTVTLTWDILYSDVFKRYEIWRDTVSDMSDETMINLISDNHTVEYENTGLAVGTYYYRVKVVNYNEIDTPSAIVTASVV